MSKLKECRSCKRNLFLNSDYFFRDSRAKDGYCSKCKECMGKKFTNKLTKIPKDGHKFCIRCDRELILSAIYFPVDRNCKDGFRNVCRECGKDGHFMKEGYTPKIFWTKKEEDLLIELYPNFLNEEIVENYFPNETNKSLKDKVYRINKERNLSVKKSRETIKRMYKLHSEWMLDGNAPNLGKTFSKETRMKISKARKGKYIGENSPLFGVPKTDEHRRKLSIYRSKLGNWKGIKNPRHKDPLYGDRNGRWQGGITEENARIRNSPEYSEWRNSVFHRDNYTCQCCGVVSDGIEAHHIVNFSSNVEKRFDVNNGITMCKDCHNPIIRGSFHHTFGTKGNNIHQLHEYMKNVSWCVNTKSRADMKKALAES